MFYSNLYWKCISSEEITVLISLFSPALANGIALNFFFFFFGMLDETYVPIQYGGSNSECFPSSPIYRAEGLQPLKELLFWYLSVMNAHTGPV